MLTLVGQPAYVDCSRSNFSDSDDSVQRHSVRLSRMRDGTIVAMGARRYLQNEDEDVFDRSTFGAVRGELILLRSHDEGHTWLGPTVVEPPLSNPLETCHAVVELADGRWLMPTSILRNRDGSAPDGVRAVALVSEDRGQTWNRLLDLLGSYEQGLTRFEVSLIQLPDQCLLAASWAFEFKSGGSHVLRYSISKDGQSFGLARSTELNAETSKLLSLGEDRVLVVSRRFDKPGLRATLVRIDGNTWVNMEEIPLWQGPDQNVRPAGISGRTESAAVRFSPATPAS